MCYWIKLLLHAIKLHGDCAPLLIKASQFENDCSILQPQDCRTVWTESIWGKAANPSLQAHHISPTDSIPPALRATEQPVYQHNPSWFQFIATVKVGYSTVLLLVSPRIAEQPFQLKNTPSYPLLSLSYHNPVHPCCLSNQQQQQKAVTQAGFFLFLIWQREN